MNVRYASQAMSGFRNYIENVAVVGVGGRSGSYMAEQLLKDGKHRVTGIVRQDSKSKIPVGIHSMKKVDYDDPAALADALQGQDALVITLAGPAHLDVSPKLIDAAVSAGVQWIMLNEWGGDMTRVEAAKDTRFWDRNIPFRERVEEIGAGKSHWLSLVCGLWYEHSLGGSEARFGFDFDKKTLTLFDDGKVKMNTTTFPQVGRAVAGLLSLKILPENENDKAPCLNDFKDRQVMVSSFHVSQRDMFASVLRASGDSESDWTISRENSTDRFKQAEQTLKSGDMIGWVKMLYTRLFFPDAPADWNDKLDNAKLGLPQEDLDEATARTIKMAQSGGGSTV